MKSKLSAWLKKWLYSLIYEKKRVRGFKIKEPSIDTTMPDKRLEFNTWVHDILKH